jgi:hypothetical protein
MWGVKPIDASRKSFCEKFRPRRTPPGADTSRSFLDMPLVSGRLSVCWPKLSVDRGRGEDVVVGAVQPGTPSEATPLLEKLEVIPLKPVSGGFAIDVDAIICRHPAVCIIDGLADDNPSGSRNAARWQDVAMLVKSGVRVIG